jgi:hypothetical protein
MQPLDEIPALLRDHAAIRQALMPRCVAPG